MSNLTIGDRAADFSLPATDGSTYSLHDLQADAQASVVIFMCNHCPYVLAWLPRLNQLAQEYSARGVSFVGINPNDASKYTADSFEGMRALVDEHGVPFPYLHDETQEVAHRFGAQRTPEIFLFGPESTLCYQGAPDDNHDVALVTQHYLRDALEAVLAGGEPPVSETPPAGCTVKWK
jgi:peroxiredoxin